MNIAIPLEENNNLLTHIVLKNVFSNQECLDILNLEGEIQAPNFYAGEYNKKPGEAKNHAVTKAINLSKHSLWLYQKLMNIVNETNKKYFNFDLAELRDVRINQYLENETLGYHTDITHGTSSTRKLSILTFLSEPDEYKGGKLNWQPALPEFVQEKGSVVIFPAFIIHEVEPVTKGTRFSLVAWAHGQHFR